MGEEEDILINYLNGAIQTSRSGPDGKGNDPTENAHAGGQNNNLLVSQ